MNIYFQEEEEDEEDEEEGGVEKGRRRRISFSTFTVFIISTIAEKSRKCDLFLVSLLFCFLFYFFPCFCFVSSTFPASVNCK